MTVKIPGCIVVADRTEDEAAWLLARTGYITATAVAAIAGSHPYYKMIDVWNELTDPDHDRDALRNRWLEERAQNGTQREPEIIAWAQADDRTGGDGAPFTATGALVTTQANIDATDVLPFAASPDAFKVIPRKGLVLLEAKTTQQDWENTGLPQHILDQCLAQHIATGALSIWVAMERYEWSGKGDARTATLVGTYLVAVIPAEHEARIAWLRERVEEFRGYYRDGIAPESDVSLAPDFDDDAEMLTVKEVADAKLTELAEITDRIAADTKRAETIKGELKAMVDEYAGRRVHLIGTRFIAKLVRFSKETINTKALDPATLRGITSWGMTQRVTFEPNPEYVAPATESE